MTHKPVESKTGFQTGERGSGNNLADNKKFFTIAETVEILKIARITVHRRLCTGEIPSLRLGSRVLVPAAFIHSLIQSPSRTNLNIPEEESVYE